MDAFTFSEGNISKNCYTLFYPFYEDKNVNDYLKRHAKPTEYWQHKIIRLSRYSDDLINSSVRGWMHDDKNYKTNQINMDEFEKQRSKWKSNISFNKELMSKLNELIHMLTKRGIKVYLVNTPTLDTINHTQPENYKYIMEYYRKLANNNMVYFIDFTKHESNYELFFDPLHLNVNGQTLVTDSLIQFLKINFKQFLGNSFLFLLCYMKHAYLIVAHTDFKILERLLDLLDYPGNDIYVHIDKKVSYDIKYHPVYSKLFTVSNEHRIDVRWADCTIAWAEMELYKLAHNHGPYGYYHLMSGIDLPLKSQNFIHRFLKNIME